MSPSENSAAQQHRECKTVGGNRREPSGITADFHRTPSKQWQQHYNCPDRSTCADAHAGTTFNGISHFLFRIMP